MVTLDNIRVDVLEYGTSHDGLHVACVFVPFYIHPRPIWVLTSDLRVATS